MSRRDFMLAGDDAEILVNVRRADKICVEIESGGARVVAYFSRTSPVSLARFDAGAASDYRGALDRARDWLRELRDELNREAEA